MKFSEKLVMKKSKSVEAKDGDYMQREKEFKIFKLMQLTFSLRRKNLGILIKTFILPQYQFIFPQCRVVFVLFLGMGII